MLKKFSLLVLIVLLGMTSMNLTPPSHAQDDTSPFGSEWFSQGIMYEVFVRSFRDTNGDGIGDLQGVIEGLDYVQSLGANIIWLMPVHPSPTYHGYDITDYYAINPDYGTVDDMLQLIQEAHSRGMYIILDYVANHSSSQHPFFLNAFNNRRSITSEFYKWRNEGQTSYAGFTPAMPELNYNTPIVRQYMIEMALYWLDPNGDGDPSDGVDGLRCDVAVGPPLSFWAELRTAMHNLNPQAVLLAEAWLRSAPELKNYLQGDAFNAAFDFPTFHALISDHNLNNDGLVSGQSSGYLLEISVNGAQHVYLPGAHLVRFINNHDTNRIMSEVEGDMARAKAAAVWLFTVPGTPMIYYGEEIGMLGSKGAGNPYWDENRREAMDWYATTSGPAMTTWFMPDDTVNLPDDGTSVEEAEADPDSLLNHYRALAALRNSTPALQTGITGTLNLSPEAKDLYAMWRGDIEDVFYSIIINFEQETVTATFQRDFTSNEIVLSSGFTLDGNSFTVEPSGYAILALTLPQE